MSRSRGFDRGKSRCEAGACGDPPEASVSVQLSTAGGRKGRVQVRATALRLCKSCLDSLATGKMPKAMANSMHVAITKMRRDA